MPANALLPCLVLESFWLFFADPELPSLMFEAFWFLGLCLSVALHHFLCVFDDFDKWVFVLARMFVNFTSLVHGCKGFVFLDYFSCFQERSPCFSKFLSELEFLHISKAQIVAILLLLLLFFFFF